MRNQSFLTLIGLTLPTLISCILLSSCSILQKTNKQEFNDGFYTHHVDNKKQKVYLNIVYDTICIHPTKIYNHQRFIDTTAVFRFLQKEKTTDYKQSTSFNKESLDIDLFTIPLKLRPKQNDVPAQLNTSLNGAVYLGYRTDKYVLKYIANSLGISNRNINHFGFSIGVFTGFGNTFMSPTNTNNVLQQEYDGIVWSKGAAGIFALNNFTIGLAFGFDNLLDKNKKIWIYEAKPCLGFAFGLNLN